MIIKELSVLFEHTYIDIRLKPTTKSGYMTNINKHIIPYIGNFNICEITYKNIDEIIEKLKTKGLSNKSVVYVMATFRKMYSFAEKRGLCNINPVKMVDMPTVKNITIIL